MVRRHHAVALHIKCLHISLNNYCGNVCDSGGNVRDSGGNICSTGEIEYVLEDLRVQIFCMSRLPGSRYGLLPEQSFITGRGGGYKMDA